MRIFALLIGFVLIGATAIFADDGVSQLLALLHVTGIWGTLIAAAIGGTGVFAFITKGIKPLQDARNIINTLVILFQKVKEKNNLDNDEKQDINNALDAIMTAMADMKLLKDKIPLIQGLKMKIDNMPSTGGPVMIQAENPAPTPAVQA
jgi:hypothetical protein